MTTDTRSARLPTPRRKRAAGQPPLDQGTFLALIDLLPPHLSQPVRLHYFEGLSFAEISEQLGMRPPSIASQICKARRKLTLLLRKWVGSADLSKILDPQLMEPHALAPVLNRFPPRALIAQADALHPEMGEAFRVFFVERCSIGDFAAQRRVSLASARLRVGLAGALVARNLADVRRLAQLKGVPEEPPGRSLGTDGSMSPAGIVSRRSVMELAAWSFDEEEAYRQGDEESREAALE